MPELDQKAVASYIDHTILMATATRVQVKQLCKEASQYNFASVCVNPCHVKLAANELKGTDVKVCTVIGFPLGANDTGVKAFEANKAVSDGALEIDMVINIGALKDGDLEFVENDIKEVVKASHGAIVKVIIETCYLTREEKILASKLAKKAGAHFVKSSTGFGTSGATKEDIALMRQIVGYEMGVKASGGVRNLQDTLEMIDAGASRIGTSSGISILNENN